MIKNKIFRNISWIVGCRIVQAVISLVISMLTARYLGPGNYGLINYAASVVALVTPLMQLGISNVLVRELVENKKEEGKSIEETAAYLAITGFSRAIAPTRAASAGHI